jgi:MSHA pilin protein MshC
MARPNQNRAYAHWCSRGFSLVELVAVLSVIGVLAAFAIPRLVGRSAYESRGFYDQAQALVRYAQKFAVAQRQSPPKPPVYVVITANQLKLCYDAACVTPLTDTSGAALLLDAPAGVTFSPATTFTFSGSGAPSFGAQLQINVTSTGTGDVNRSFFVEAFTGHVHP